MWQESSTAVTGAAIEQSHSAENHSNGAAPVKNQPAVGGKRARFSCASITLAALPFHHLMPLEKLVAAYSTMTDSLRQSENGGDSPSRSTIGSTVSTSSDAEGQPPDPFT